MCEGGEERKKKNKIHNQKIIQVPQTEIYVHKMALI